MNPPFNAWLREFHSSCSRTCKAQQDATSRCSKVQQEQEQDNTMGSIVALEDMVPGPTTTANVKSAYRSRIFKT